jgi:endonuclease/exonuclease/phosphatase family metal-dependent hydrolase
MIGSASWHVCLLQEFPPRWCKRLATTCSAHVYLVKTSRNLLAPLRGAIADWNPDLIGANEGGSNAIAVRAPWKIVSKRSLVLNPLPGRGLAERRKMGFVRLTNGQADICVSNFHASAGNQAAAEQEILRAAEHAIDWAGDLPLVFGGDFNVRPQGSALFERLENDYGLAPPTARDAIDHILVRGLEVTSHPAPWPAPARELEIPHAGRMRRLRLSDHAPVEATVALPPERIQ